ncbi:SagB family peptide dehydrogenase [Pseudalkalibacillus sp. Hm43]|uniref:SagB family peptide dehydrogenase n=1 Tax=Pseudalkalibacillus sp. Hm43 TaxID=3450742 RepID=UPI003F43DDB1
MNDFLYNLHYDIERVSPPDWEVDWDDAPLPYKLYRNLRVVPLSSEVPLTFEKVERKPTMENMSHFLWFTYGLNQVSQAKDVFTEDVSQSLRRFVPSGGGLYPNEIYLYVKVEGVTPGIYHYDVAHHRLVCLREGNFDDYIQKTLGGRCDMAECFAAVFISTMFWKNFFKYNNFSYRLQGLDAGVAIGQLLEVSKQYGYETNVYYQFLDQPLNHLLGFDDQDENVYAVIPLSEKTIRTQDTKTYTAETVVGSIPAIQSDHYVHSQKVLDFPMIQRMNDAIKIESTEQFSEPVKSRRKPIQGGFLLPNGEPLSENLMEAYRRRYSPGMDFTMGKIPLSQVATMLQHTMNAPPRSDSAPSLAIAGCFYNVEGLPDGAYEYDHCTHTLRLLKKGDFRLQLQAGMTAHNVNLYQVPLCFHIISPKEFRKRDYRILQMEAGRLLQRLLTAATVLGLGGHPLLGFDVKLCDDIYSYRHETCLIQVPIGPVHPRVALRGSLF